MRIFKMKKNSYLHPFVDEIHPIVPSRNRVTYLLIESVRMIFSFLFTKKEEEEKQRSV